MANSFSKEERVAFAELCKGFEDALVLSSRIMKYGTSGQMMERAGDTIWRPMPYIMTSYDGLDQTANFNAITNLSVPAQLTDIKSVPWYMTARELRDGIQNNRATTAAFHRLASDINVRILRTACYYGSIFSKRSAAASGFDDVADLDTRMNRVGIPMDMRTAAYTSGSYNGMASNLAARQTLQGMTSEAFRAAYVGNVAGFETFKMDYGLRLPAKAGSSVTINGAGQYYTPKATQTAASGETSNVDNRFQTISITVGSGTVAVGDAFTIAGVNEVHHITKLDTGELKTFRIVDIVTGSGGTGTVQITPPIISNGGGTRAEAMYQNVTATPANGAAITFLNTVAGDMNPFWYADALEILPGNLEVETGAGIAVMRATLENGVPVLMTKWTTGETLQSRYRVDTFFGVVNKQPEMTGIQMFSQT